MHRVEIKLSRSAPLAEKLMQMRAWLDHQGLEPVNFFYDVTPQGRCVRLDFRIEGEAAAFAQGFDGEFVIDGHAVLMSDSASE
jgi:hypothetical protein